MKFCRPKDSKLIVQTDMQTDRETDRQMELKLHCNAAVWGARSAYVKCKCVFSNEHVIGSNGGDEHVANDLSSRTICKMWSTISKSCKHTAQFTNLT